MIVWRVSNHATLDGAGGLRASARWHTKGRRIVYCAPNPASALLETLVHLEVDLEDVPASLQYLKIEIPDTASFEQAFAKDENRLMPGSGHSGTSAECQLLGDAWLDSGRSALLYVPSVIVPETRNILLNPGHAELRNARILAKIKYPLDARLVE